MAGLVPVWLRRLRSVHTRHSGEVVTKANEPGKRCNRAPGTISAFRAESLYNILAQLEVLLGDVFALHVKTKGLQNRIASLYSPDYRRLLGEQADQILAMTHRIAGRIRNLGGTKTHSTRPSDREIEGIAGSPGSSESPGLLRELREDNASLIMRMTQLYDLCDDTNDLATADFLQIWIDETQRRVWFLGDTGERRRFGIVQ